MYRYENRRLLSDFAPNVWENKKDEIAKQKFV